MNERHAQQTHLAAQPAYQSPPQLDMHNAHTMGRVAPAKPGTGQLPVLAVPSGIRFSLPEMKGPRVAQPAVTAQFSTKSLSPGFLSGGSGTSQAEMLRLQGAVEDLTIRLKKTTEKLATTEQSVLRGNRSLQKERQLSHARIIALQSEVKNASEREAAVRQEMAAMPKISDLDTEKFRIQTEGAIQLEAQYEQEKELRLKAEQKLGDEIEASAHIRSSLEELEAERDAIKATHAALELSHATACDKLEKAIATTTSEISQQLQDELKTKDERVTELQVELSELRESMKANGGAEEVETKATPASEEAATAGAVHPDVVSIGYTFAMLKTKLTETEKRLVEATDAAASAKKEFEVKELQSTQLIEELDSKLAHAREEVRRAKATHEALRSIDNITQEIDKLEVEMTAGCGCGSSRPEANLPSPVGSDEEEESQKAEDAPPDESQKDEADPSKEEGQPAAKSAASAGEAVIEPEHRLLWEKHHAHRVAADAATDLAIENPEDHALAASAARKRMQAMRAHKELFGLSSKPTIRYITKTSGCCDANNQSEHKLDDIVCDKDQIRYELNCAINASMGQFGVASIALQEADLALTGVPVSGKRKQPALQNAAMGDAAKQERTVALVQALTSDLKNNFTDLNATWSATLQMKATATSG